MKIHALLHAPFEKLGVIEDWINERGALLSTTHTYKNAVLPETSTFDFLIVMGGPQSTHDLNKYPFLKDEITLVKKAIKDNKTILGICLGAQIIAEALGARVMKSPHSEIGVYPVKLTNAGKTDPLFRLFKQEFQAMHWHNDMPGITNESVLLASSEGCPHQAFRYGEKIYGLQFHLEMNTDCIKAMIANCSQDLKSGPYIQNKEQLLTNDLQNIHHHMRLTLDYLASTLMR